MKKEGLHDYIEGKENARTTLGSFFVSFSFVNSAGTMAQAKTSEDKFFGNRSHQFDHEESNWDENLAPTPLSIAIMSQLLICSTQVTDFAINSKIDKNTINLVIHPESFHKTLVQIVNDYYEALMLAQKNMDKIQLQMAQVPDDVKKGVKLFEIFMTDNKTAIDKFVPRRLEIINKKAADGLKYSTQVRDAFDRLGQLIRQVTLAIQASRGATTEEIEKLKRKEIEDKKNRQLEYKKREKDLLQKELEGAQEAVQRTQKKMEKAELRNEDLVLGFGIPFFVRNAISYFNKTQAKNWLRDIKEKAKQVEEESEKIYDEYANSVKNLQINVGNDKTDEIIKLLQDGTKQLGELHEQWAGMTMYFQAINNYIDKVTKKLLVDFVGDAKGAQHNALFLKLMIDSIEKSLESSTKSHSSHRITSPLQRIAATYVKVSDDYFADK